MSRQRLDVNSNQAVVVTGASSGIGRATAEWLSNAGYTTFPGIRTSNDSDSLTQTLRNAPGEVRPVYLDVRDPDSLKEAAASVERHLEGVGPLGTPWSIALVNNAGTTFTGPLEFIPLDDFREQLEINLTGQLSVAQEFLPVIRRFGGRMVFVGSMFGQFSAPFIGPYCASKAALASMTDSFAMELRPWGIPVSLIEAGVTQTSIWSKYEKRSNRLFERLPEAARELYGEHARQTQRHAMVEARNGMPAERVARTVETALSSVSPKLRYQVGADARAAILGSSVLPRSLFHSITLARMGIRRRG